MHKLLTKQNKLFKASSILFIGSALLFVNPEKSFANNLNSHDLPKEGDIDLIVNNTKEPLPYSTVNKWFEFTPYLIKNDLYQSEIENVDYCPSHEGICALTYSLESKYHTQRKVISQLNKEDISFYVATLSQKVNKEPKNAKIKFNSESKKIEVISLETNGLELKVSESAQKIIDEISNAESLPTEITLDYEIKKADVRSDNLKQLGISELIGEGKSNFRGSTPTRIHNIKTAIGKFDGIIIKPGEEFSFVKTLGDVDEKTGYKEELVIKKDKTEKEFGGGICQVSTTTFRAAIYSGLEITARRNHAYPVHYYDPQGMDAAIYIPSPDLKFVNNTPNYILVQADMNEATNDLSFKFYGTSDKRKVEVEGPFITEKNDDGSMKTYFTRKVFDKTGKLVIDEEYKSSYASPENYPKTEKEAKDT